MDESKGLFDLLDAAARLESEGVPFRLDLAGPWASDRIQARFEKRVRADHLAAAVRYVGVASGQRRETLLKQADVLVLPSHSEVMPISVLEAMARSLPVIGTRVGAIPEMVRNHLEGLIIQPGNGGALARSMRVLAEDPGLRRSLGHQARLRIERSYSDTAQAEAVLDLYRTLLQPGFGPVLPCGRRRWAATVATVKPSGGPADTTL
jgi:glycosyltransferase involved in cell wall biosynthesis